MSTCAGSKTFRYFGDSFVINRYRLNDDHFCEADANGFMRITIVLLSESI